MPTNMEQFRYFYPPRTTALMPPGLNPVRQLWNTFPDAIGQYKLNGTRNMTVIHPSGQIELWGRHKEIQKQIRLSPPMLDKVLSLKLAPGKLHILDGEFIQAKTSDIKDVLYQFDILVHNSEHLLGMTYGDRYNLLKQIMFDAGMEYFPLDFQPQIGTMYLAQNFPHTEWPIMYQKSLHVPYCEGIVVKRTRAVSALEYGANEVNNAGWMARMRKPQKNYNI